MSCAERLAEKHRKDIPSRQGINANSVMLRYAKCDASSSIIVQQTLELEIYLIFFFVYDLQNEHRM